MPTIRGYLVYRLPAGPVVDLYERAARPTGGATGCRGGCPGPCGDSTTSSTDLSGDSRMVGASGPTEFSASTVNSGLATANSRRRRGECMAPDGWLITTVILPGINSKGTHATTDVARRDQRAAENSITVESRRLFDERHVGRNSNREPAISLRLLRANIRRGPPPAGSARSASRSFNDTAAGQLIVSKISVAEPGECFVIPRGQGEVRHRRFPLVGVIRRNGGARPP